MLRVQSAFSNLSGKCAGDPDGSKQKGLIDYPPIEAQCNNNGTVTNCIELKPFFLYIDSRHCYSILLLIFFKDFQNLKT